MLGFLSNAVILPAVQNDASFFSSFPRKKRFHHDIGNFQQSRDLFTASIETARSINPEFALGCPSGSAGALEQESSSRMFDMIILRS